MHESSASLCVRPRSQGARDDAGRRCFANHLVSQIYPNAGELRDSELPLPLLESEAKFQSFVLHNLDPRICRTKSTGDVKCGKENPVKPTVPASLPSLLWEGGNAQQLSLVQISPKCSLFVAGPLGGVTPKPFSPFPPLRGEYIPCLSHEGNIFTDFALETISQPLPLCPSPRALPSHLTRKTLPSSASKDELHQHNILTLSAHLDIVFFSSLPSPLPPQT